MNTGDLQQAMQSGSTLAQLAQQKGVPQDDLIFAISSDLQANLPAGAAQPSQSQLTQFATDVAEGKGPHHHHHHRGAQGGAADSASSTDGASASSRSPPRSARR